MRDSANGAALSLALGVLVLFARATTAPPDTGAARGGGDGATPELREIAALTEKRTSASVKNALRRASAGAPLWREPLDVGALAALHRELAALRVHRGAEHRHVGLRVHVAPAAARASAARAAEAGAVDEHPVDVARAAVRLLQPGDARAELQSSLSRRLREVDGDDARTTCRTDHDC